jgi:LmbE family N-acetylglucosaminyl deacetylase
MTVVLPTLENRRMLTRLIREWKADIVLGHRPNDYHPDHRYLGVLIGCGLRSDGFVFVRMYTAHENPVFVYYNDRFKNQIRSGRTCDFN